MDRTNNEFAATVRNRGRGMRVCKWAMMLLALSAQAPMPAAAAGNSVQVLHWWTSASERKAANVLATRLAEENIEWRDGAIPGGAGLGAGKVLKSRVLAGNAPDATQLVGANLAQWAEWGLLLELTRVAQGGAWDKTLFPTIWTLIRHRNHVIAAPLGIHRINTLFYNRKLFDRLGIAPPQTWEDFERVATRLQQAGIVPLAQSSESWQVVTLFETLVLSEGGPAYYRELFVKSSPAAFADPRLAQALRRLRSLKAWMGPPVKERPWTEAARQLADGNAAMMVMGDWVKGEFNAWGMATDAAFGCAAVPHTAQYHLYSVDTLAMFAADYSRQGAQEKLAQVAMSPITQSEYNQIKGSIPVLRNPDMTRMDSCAKASWQAFARGSAAQAPSLVHRMATDEITKDAIIAEVHRYFLDDRIQESDVQQRLGAITRALSKKGSENDAQNFDR